MEKESVSIEYKSWEVEEDSTQPIAMSYKELENIYEEE